jgi:hypothetical protein
MVVKAGTPGFSPADTAVRKYLDALRPSNCPSCGKAQKTPRGEPMVCPRCTGRQGTVDRPTVPLHAQTEMAQRKGRGPDLERLGE